MKQPTRAKRCKNDKCKKIVRSHNKSGYCHHCVSNMKKRNEKRKKCFICEERCCGKMLIEWQKNRNISVCTFHFNWLLAPKFTDPKELRKEIKRLKGCH